MSRAGPFLLEQSQGGGRAAELLAWRAEVFAGAGFAPETREWDALDTLSLHVLARDDAGRLVGAARLSPDQRIGRLGVRPEWRCQGMGSALLEALLDQARQRGWVQVRAAATAAPFLARAGFLPVPGQPDQWQRRLDGPMAIEEAGSAVHAASAVLGQARRELCIYSRALDPGMLDAPAVLAALRRFATQRHDKLARILLQDTRSPQLLDSPLLHLAQRLPTVFQFRAVRDPIDANYPSAYLVGDARGYYFRSTGNRYDDGETWLEGAARARQLRTHFEQIWERSRPWSEHRALGL